MFYFLSLIVVLSKILYLLLSLLIFIAFFTLAERKVLKQESKLGILNRGCSSQIGQYSKRLKSNFLASNVIEYCPVSSDSAYGTSTRTRGIQFALNTFGYGAFFLLIFSISFIILTYVINNNFLLHTDLVEGWEEVLANREKLLALQKKGKFSKGIMPPLTEILESWSTTRSS